MTLSLVVYHQERQVYSTRFDAPLEIGRQQQGEPEPYCQVSTDDGIRVVLASLGESSLSRQQVRIEPATDGNVHVVNLSAAVPIATDNAGPIEPNGYRDLAPPFVLAVGDRSLRVEEAQQEQLQLVSLADATMAPGRHRPPSTRLQSIAAIHPEGDQGETLIQWMYAAMSVLQSAASSPDFLQQAAQAVVDLVDLDIAAVLRWDGAEWISEAVAARSGSISSRWRPSSTVLDQARAEKRTFRNTSNLRAVSLMGVEALVAAPILDAEGDVIAALYGDRRQPAPDRDSLDITPLEAMLVELLASGVAAGLARLEQEREAVATRVRFEQAFTPELVRQLEAQPDLLAGKDADISVLFCDVRSFSRISERLGPVRTFSWIGDVMDKLSECVQHHEGVLVDYIGDELIAMWGTPVEHPDHALRACRAALEMVQSLNDLNQQWQAELGEEMDVGIGINSGVARVGNTGTKRKFKYGPLGNTVNLASRVQGATKHMRSRVLITGSTMQQLGPELERRRLSRVRVVNIEEPVDLYQLIPAADQAWCHFRDQYEAALQAFESGEFFTATKYLGNLVAEHPNDGPSQLLLSRAVNAMIDPEAFDSVWNLTSK
jgi:adenylate cyclase